MKNDPTVDEWLAKLSGDLQLITGELMAVARVSYQASCEYENK